MQTEHGSGQRGTETEGLAAHESKLATATRRMEPLRRDTAAILARLLRYLTESGTPEQFAQSVLDDIVGVFEGTASLLFLLKPHGYQLEAVSRGTRLSFETDVTELLRALAAVPESRLVDLSLEKGWSTSGESFVGLGRSALVSARPLDGSTSLLLCIGDGDAGFDPDELALFAQMAPAAHEAASRLQAAQNRQRIEVQSRQSRRLEALGTLASGIAHEINTPVQFVSDNLRFLQDSVNRILADNGGDRPSDEDRAFLQKEIPASIAESIAGMEQISRIIASMRGFSHPGRDGLEPTDVNETLKSVVTLCRSELKNVADVLFDLDPLLPRLMAQPSELSQVLLNLVVNAAHALQESATSRDGRRGFLALRTRCETRGELIIEIEDSGVGIPDEIRERIFDPFFTTKDVGRGTGQGLAYVYDIVVNRHGGRIDVLSYPGEGTCITLVLKEAAPTAV